MRLYTGMLLNKITSFRNTLLGVLYIHRLLPSVSSLTALAAVI